MGSQRTLLSEQAVPIPPPPNGSNDGWDYITEFTLDVETTIAEGGDPEECKKHGAQTSQSIIYENGDIVRQVIIRDFPGGLICVPMFNMRLALGSGQNPGASLHAYFKIDQDGSAVGEHTLPINVGPSGAFSKTMTALRDGKVEWTVTKTANSASIDFGDTCTDDTSALEKDIEITVAWERRLTEEGTVNVTTTISATNAAQRPIDIEVTDTLYSGTTQLGEPFECNRVRLPKDVTDYPVCTHTFTIDDPAQAVDLNDKAVATFIDPDHPEAEVEYKKVTPQSAEVQNSGSNKDETAIIKDKEWIVGDVNYSVESVNGYFSGYTLKDITDQDIN